MGRNKKYFDEYEEYRLYQDAFGTEVSNDKVFEGKENHKSRRTKTTKRPLTKEELDRNGMVIRIVFITLGLIFSILTLWNNIGWLLFNPAFVSWIGIIISIVIIVLIVRNVIFRRR